MPLSLKPSWKNHWSVKYIFSHVPFFGGPLKEYTICNALNHELKHRLGSLSGTFFMILPQLMQQSSRGMESMPGMSDSDSHEMSESPPQEFVIMWLWMELGMMSGAIAYDCLVHGLVLPAFKLVCHNNQHSESHPDYELANTEHPTNC